MDGWIGIHFVVFMFGIVDCLRPSSPLHCISYVGSFSRCPVSILIDVCVRYVFGLVDWFVFVCWGALCVGKEALSCLVNQPLSHDRRFINGLI